jgi:hypothetical protein
LGLWVVGVVVVGVVPVEFFGELAGGGVGVDEEEFGVEDVGEVVEFFGAQGCGQGGVVGGAGGEPGFCGGVQVGSGCPEGAGDG